MTNEETRRVTLLKIMALPLHRRIRLVRLIAKKRGLHFPLPYGLPNSDEQDVDVLPIVVKPHWRCPANNFRYARDEPAVSKYDLTPLTTVLVID